MPVRDLKNDFLQTELEDHHLCTPYSILPYTSPLTQKINPDYEGAFKFLIQKEIAQVGLRYMYSVQCIPYNHLRSYIRYVVFSIRMSI